MSLACRRIIQGTRRPRSGKSASRATETIGLLKCWEAKSQTRRLIAIEVRIVAEEEQAFESFGFEQDFVRHPLAFALQILDQPVDGPDNTPVQHLVLASCIYILSHHRSEGFEFTRRIPLPAPCERLLENTVLIDYQCRQPVFFRARHFVSPPRSKRRRRMVRLQRAPQVSSLAKIRQPTFVCWWEGLLLPDIGKLGDKAGAIRESED